MNIEKLKQDHVDIMSMVTQLKTLTKSGIVENADAIAKQIITMSSVIKMHLAAEDRSLYPALAKSTDPAVARIGKKFQLDMGGIAAAYMKFAGDWNLGTRVSSNPEGFREDANTIFKALHERIQIENKELYPLADGV